MMGFLREAEASRALRKETMGFSSAWARLDACFQFMAGRGDPTMRACLQQILLARPGVFNRSENCGAYYDREGNESDHESEH
jgi:hypothetical protein